MRLIKPNFEIMEIMAHHGTRSALSLIERAGRTCYKSEARMTDDSYHSFVSNVITRGHESVIEHSAMTVKFIIDRGVSHELVRHRLCAFSQESTRYCNYGDEVTFVIPPWTDLEPGLWDYSSDGLILPVSSQQGEKELRVLYDLPAYQSLLRSWKQSEISYRRLIKNGWSPQQARGVLPNGIKTEIVVTANFREWRHIFRLRCNSAAHPQMREVMIPLLQKCKTILPIIFDDIQLDC